MQVDDQSEFEQEQPAGETTAEFEQPSEPEAAPAGESRVGQWLRRSLRWIAGLAFVFAVGVLLVFFVRVRPQSDQIRSLQRQFDESQQQLATAQARVEQLEPLRDENQLLMDRLDQSERHLELLSVLVDVTNAQLDLTQDQPDSAKAALEDTDAKLEALLEGLEGREAEAFEAMRNRLELVLEGLEEDTFAAQRDLEIMANNLVELERQMFLP